ncbi:AI-2E family transporter [Aestuariicella hydrocarbonica]|uniref:AI-2E family transporter n=1 Tax=Pseudomaricurvus hydrocarbonicus TaxID=1470433 RepID=A0A9E5JP94_9GAMM|nr:AI-2E family transporter [Aestuariicella hydrocarbonica]NHO64077.1 AI-2E family transporter [Aestuariicella hydrocarbonica]
MALQDTPVARFLIVMAAFVIVIAGMRAAESVLIPFLLSLFIAMICTPPFAWLKKKGIPSWLALLIMLLAIVGIGFLVGMVVGSSINEFREDLPQYQERLQFLSLQLQELLQGRGIELPNQMWKEVFNPNIALAFVGNTLASFGNVMTNAILILLTVLFVLAEEVRFSDKMLSAHPEAERAVTVLKRFTHSVNQYMAIKTSLSLLTGFLVMGWVWWLGVDYPALWGLLAFLLNFIPNLGSILAAVPTVLLALIQLGVPDAVLTAAGYVAINMVVGNLLEPRIMGKGLDLSTLVVFLSLVFWGWVFGPVGMLLSVPLTMMVKFALESLEGTRWLGVMLGSGKDMGLTENVSSPELL